jgi:hypothetical protein
MPVRRSAGESACSHHQRLQSLTIKGNDAIVLRKFSQAGRRIHKFNLSSRTVDRREGERQTHNKLAQRVLLNRLVQIHQVVAVELERQVGQDAGEKGQHNQKNTV